MAMIPVPPDYPAMMPPDGEQSIFDNPPNQTTASYVALTLFIVISTIMVILRLVMKWFVLHQVTWGDALLITAYGLFMAQLGLLWYVVQKYGFFVHMWNIRAIEAAGFVHPIFVIISLFCVFVPMIKAAILMEWMRIFVPRGQKNFIFWSSHFVIWANVIFYIMIIVVANTGCTPYEYNWNRLLIGGSCKNTAWTGLASSTFNVVVDVAILLIPQRAIWQLKITTQKKMGVAAVFVIGILGIVCAGIRDSVTISSTTSQDFSYVYSSIMIWAGAEGTCAFMVVCGPILPKAFKTLLSTLTSGASKVASRLGGSSGNSRSGGSSTDRMRRTKRGSAAYANLESRKAGGVPVSDVPLAQLRPADGSVVVRSAGTIIKSQSQTALRKADWGSGIVRDTEIDVSEEFVPTNADPERYLTGGRHPWGK